MVTVAIFSLYPEKATRVKLEYLSLSRHYDVKIIHPYAPNILPGILRSLFRYIYYLFQLLFVQTDIIHYSNIPDFQALISLIRPRVKFVYDIRSIFSSNLYDYTGSYFVHRLVYHMEELISKRADLVITANRYLKKRAELMGATNVVTVPNFPLPIYKQTKSVNEIREDVGSGNRFVFLIVTNLTRQKPIDEMIQELDKLSTAFPISLWIIGDGKDGDRLRNIASNVNLDVHFIGYIPINQLGNYIAASDVCLAVYPNRNPKIPRFYSYESVWKVGEYALFKKPIIAINMLPSLGLISVEMNELADKAKELLQLEEYPLLKPYTWKHSHKKLIRAYENYLI